MRYLAVKNFERFQHYKDRMPPWVKLYRDLWRDRDFFRLSERSKLLFIGLTTIASITGNRIPEDPEWIAAELSLPAKSIAFKELIEAGFLQDADGPNPRADWPSRYIPDELRASVLERDQHRCRECQSVENLEIDHVVPVSKLPAEWKPAIGDLQTLCRSCNRRKRAKLSAEQVATETPSPAEQQPIVETEKSRDRGETETDQGKVDDVISVQELFESWNELCPPLGLPAIRELSASRRQKAAARVREHPKVAFWNDVFREIKRSAFLRGMGPANGKEPWRANFDWLIENDTNCIKTAEGRYGKGPAINSSSATG